MRPLASIAFNQNGVVKKNIIGYFIVRFQVMNYIFYITFYIVIIMITCWSVELKLFDYFYMCFHFISTKFRFENDGYIGIKLELKF